MIAISKSFTNRISRDFSNLSAICPAVAENRKNGRMNSAAQTFTSVALGIVERLAAWKVIGEHQRVLVDVVVERAEELRQEERQEAPLAQQAELAVGKRTGHGGSRPVARPVPSVAGCGEHSVGTTQDRGSGASAPEDLPRRSDPARREERRAGRHASCPFRCDSPYAGRRVRRTCGPAPAHTNHLPSRAQAQAHASRTPKAPEPGPWPGTVYNRRGTPFVLVRLRIQLQCVRRQRVRGRIRLDHVPGARTHALLDVDVRAERHRIGVVERVRQRLQRIIGKTLEIAGSRSGTPPTHRCQSRKYQPTAVVKPANPKRPM